MENCNEHQPSYAELVEADSSSKSLLFAAFSYGSMERRMCAALQRQLASMKAKLELDMDERIKLEVQRQLVMAMTSLGTAIEAQAQTTRDHITTVGQTTCDHITTDGEMTRDLMKGEFAEAIYTKQVEKDKLLWKTMDIKIKRIEKIGGKIDDKLEKVDRYLDRAERTCESTKSAKILEQLAPGKSVTEHPKVVGRCDKVWADVVKAGVSSPAWRAVPAENMFLPVKETEQVFISEAAHKGIEERRFSKGQRRRPLVAVSVNFR